MAGLKRELGLFRLSVYALGDILGAGIYALVGKVAAFAGNLVWLSFLMAGACAVPTALCYAELSSRFPRAGGAAVFIHHAFGGKTFPRIVGFMVLASGMISSATIANAFAGYFGQLLPVSREMIIIGFILFLSLTNFVGINQSALLNLVCVIVEAGGLLLILFLGCDHWGSVNYLMAPEGAVSIWGASLAGAALAFYAFIGFEDLCNLSDDAVRPERDIPAAIVLALATAAVMYIGIAITVVSVVPFSELAASPAPMALVMEGIASFIPPRVMTFIALFALTNTALANLIMASRLLYGMSNEGWLHRVFSFVHQGRGTPLVAIGVVFVISVTIALIGRLTGLARLANANILAIFFFVNLALIIIHRRGGVRPSFRVPRWLPYAGAVLSLVFLAKNIGVI